MDEKCVAFVRVCSNSRTSRFLKLIRQWSIVGFLLSTTLFSTPSLAADTTKPTTPSNVTVTATSSSVITLAWTASTDNVGVTGYSIERCTGTSCTTWAQIALAPSPNYTDTGLTVATAYRYRIRATDAAGNFSSYSTIKSVTTLDDQVPTAPLSLTATVNSPIKITLTWTAATDNVKVTGYRLESCAGVGCSNFVQIATTTTGLTYGNTGLTPVTTYQYRVRAIDAAGNLSAYSSVVSATTLADTTKPTAPTALTATPISSAQIDLSWTASTDAVGVTGYRIERCTGTTCTNYVQIATTTTTAYSNTVLAPLTAYRYRVRANDASGNLSSYSSAVVGTTPTFSDTQAPSVPASLTAAAVSGTQINLSWGTSIDNVGVTGYQLERCQGAGCATFTQIASLTATTYTDSGLSPATTYSYRVRATDAANNLSGYSSTANAATQYAGPITFTYSYDALGRISHATGSDGSSIDYQYDANGNVTIINRQ